MLIISDDDASVLEVARGISAAVAPPSLEGYSVSARKADAFYGTDMLPAHAFFIGCGSPSPLSFRYVEELLARVNLAGRPCGVFATTPKALDYLRGLVAPCEAVAGKPLLAKGGAIGEASLREWAKSVLEKGGER